MALEKDTSLHLPLYGEGFLCCSAVVTLIFIMAFLLICWWSQKTSCELIWIFFFKFPEVSYILLVAVKYWVGFSERPSSCSIVQLALYILSFYMDLHELSM